MVKFYRRFSNKGLLIQGGKCKYPASAQHLSTCSALFPYPMMENRGSAEQMLRCWQMPGAEYLY